MHEKTGSKVPYCQSFTAPTFSAEDSRIERENLTQAEREEIEGDLSGTSAILHETPEFLGQALTSFDKALASVSDSQKHPYLQALSTASALVHEESHPLKFLRAEGFRAEAAVLRMLNYWDLRLELFGTDRAFLPMSVMDGVHGAMDDKDIEVLQQGSIVILPKCDAFERNVIYADRSKWTLSAREQTLRAIFWTFHIAGVSEVAQKHGCVLLMDLQRFSTEDQCRKLSKKSILIYRDSSPIRVRTAHALFVAKRSEPMLMLPSILLMIGKTLRLRLVQHYGNPSELCWDLEQFGLTQDMLPEALGGNYTCPTDWFLELNKGA